MQEFHCTVYKDYKISIPSKIRKLLSISPHDEVVLKVKNNNEIVFATVQQELMDIQQEVKKFFDKKSIVLDFLATKMDDYDDS